MFLCILLWLYFNWNTTFGRLRFAFVMCLLLRYAADCFLIGFFCGLKHFDLYLFCFCLDVLNFVLSFVLRFTYNVSLFALLITHKL